MTCLPIFGYQHSSTSRGVKTILTELFAVLLMRRYEIRICRFICISQSWNILQIEKLTVTICIIWADLISSARLPPFYLRESNLKYSTRRNNVGRNETMVDIIRFSISRIFMYTGLAYFSQRFYGELRGCNGEMNKRICGSFSGALFSVEAGMVGKGRLLNYTFK